MGSPYLHGLHTQHAMLGAFIQYSVWGPHIYTGLMHSMLCWGRRLDIVWSPHIYMGSMYNMLCWGPILWSPISTWALCTGCYVGGLDSVQCEVLIFTWVHVMLGSYSVGSPYLHGFHEQYVRPLCIVWGPHIYMCSMHNMLCWGLRLSIVWGPHICHMHGSHIHDWSPIYSVGSPHLHGFRMQICVLKFHPYYIIECKFVL